MRAPQQELFAKSPRPEMGDVERAASRRGESVIIGVDEAGRGPLAGPVHVAAVSFDLDALYALSWHTQLNDSKKVKEADRERLFDLIKAHARAWAICVADRATIDSRNILQATKDAMADAITQVNQQLDGEAERAYIDGNQYVATSIPQSAVVKGDSRSYHIAAASILAKVSRDRYMIELGQTWPEYGFAQHKGYGTKAHREAIATHGPCPSHRQSFSGVKEHLDRLRERP